MRKIDITEAQVDFAPMHESLFRKLIRILSINGFLIPNFLLKDRCVFQPKGFRTIFRQAFGYKRILYIYEPESIGYIAEHNKREIISELILFLITIFKFYYQFTGIRKKYQKEIPSMTSEQFWRDVYSDDFQS
jgi:hypothetical protein